MKSSQAPITDEQDSALDRISGKTVEKHTQRIIEDDPLKLEIYAWMNNIKYPSAGGILVTDYAKALKESEKELLNAKLRKSSN